MFKAFEITVSFGLGEREENLVKSGVNNVRREH